MSHPRNIKSDKDSIDIVDEIYQQRKNAHQMPNELKASIHSAISEQLKTQIDSKPSSILRHPAFGLCFSLVLIVGVLLNNWDSVEHQLAPLPVAPQMRDIGNNSVNIEYTRLEPEITAMAPESQVVEAFKAPAENWDYAQQQNNQHQKRLVAQSQQTSARTEAEQRFNQINNEQIASLSKTQNNGVNYESDNRSNSNNGNDNSQAQSNQGVVNPPTQAAKIKYKQASKSKIANLKVEPIATQGSSKSNDAFSDAATIDEVNSTVNIDLAMPQLRLFTVKAIDNKQIYLIGCQQQNHTLSLSKRPNTKVGDKLVVKTRVKKSLPKLLDALSNYITPVSANTQCE